LLDQDELSRLLHTIYPKSVLYCAACIVSFFALLAARSSRTIEMIISQFPKVFRKSDCKWLGCRLLHGTFCTSAFACYAQNLYRCSKQ